MELLSIVGEIEMNDETIVILYFLKKSGCSTRVTYRKSSLLSYLSRIVDSPLKFELLKSLSRHEYHKTQMKLLQHVWGMFRLLDTSSSNANEISLGKESCNLHFKREQ